MSSRREASDVGDGVEPIGHPQVGVEVAAALTAFQMPVEPTSAFRVRRVAVEDLVNDLPRATTIEL